MEELTDNAEEIAEEGDSTKDDKKLGRLQFKVYIYYRHFPNNLLQTNFLNVVTHG